MIEKKLRVIRILCVLLIIVLSSPLFIRAFVADSFLIKGISMMPTFKNGERVWVNKLILGPRIYTSPILSTPQLKCIRIPGIRKLRAGDIAIMNSPIGWGGGRIDFKINSVYCKRCCGCPGDTVIISDCHISNSRVGDIPGYSYEGEAILRNEPDSLLLKHNCLMSGQFAGMDSLWTIKNMGPIYVPSKGDVIPMTSYNAKMYAMVIEYETGKRPLESDQSAENGSIKVYVFKEDYYFFVGDFLADSLDSRYIGFVPEKYIIGIVSRKKCRL